MIRTAWMVGVLTLFHVGTVQLGGGAGGRIDQNERDKKREGFQGSFISN